MALNHIQPQKARFTIWELKNNVSIPTEASPRKWKPHRYLIIAIGDPNIPNSIATCVPISTDKINNFSVPLSFYNANGGLKHGSHALCDIVVSLRMWHFDAYLGDIVDNALQSRITDSVALWLGI